MGLQVVPQLVSDFNRNQDFDSPVVFVYYYQQYMIKFSNQPELNNSLGIVSTLYIKDVHSLEFCDWFLKK